MVNKKGQEMSVATLVLIVIGIVILVLLVLGFSMGWQNLWNKINIFGGGSNVEAVTQACKISASSASTYSYCSEFKKVTIDGKIQYINCQDSRVAGIENPLDCGKDAAASAKKYCTDLMMAAAPDTAKQNAVLKIMVNGQTCEALGTVIVLPTTETCNSLGGAWRKTPCLPDETDVTSQVTDNTGKDTNTICCLA